MQYGLYASHVGGRTKTIEIMRTNHETLRSLGRSVAVGVLSNEALSTRQHCLDNRMEGPTNPPQNGQWVLFELLGRHSAPLAHNPSLRSNRLEFTRSPKKRGGSSCGWRLGEVKGIYTSHFCGICSPSARNYSIIRLVTTTRPNFDLSLNLQ